MKNIFLSLGSPSPRWLTSRPPSRRTDRSAAPSSVAAGATAGGIAEANPPRFHSYVSERHHSSYRYDRDLRVGTELPESGVTYYEYRANMVRRPIATPSSTTGPSLSIPPSIASLK
jgi:hypothetical protein